MDNVSVKQCCNCGSDEFEVEPSMLNKFVGFVNCIECSEPLCEVSLDKNGNVLKTIKVLCDDPPPPSSKNMLIDSIAKIRVDVSVCNCDLGAHIECENSKDGDYVKYDDVIAIIEKFAWEQR